MNTDELKPVPQGLLQLVQLLQKPKQSSGHGCVLHACVRTAPLSASQALPPCWAGVVIVKVEFWLPPAQAAVQFDQSLQLLVQSTGQGVVFVQLVVNLCETGSRVAGAVRQAVVCKLQCPGLR